MTRPNVRWHSLEPHEHDEQAVLFAWLALQHFHGAPLSDWYFHIPNGGKRDLPAAALLKTLGVKAGACDIFGMIPATPYHGHFIEMKRATRGWVSHEQRCFIERARAMGYCVDVCKGFESAQACIRDYLSLGR